MRGPLRLLGCAEMAGPRVEIREVLARDEDYGV